MLLTLENLLGYRIVALDGDIGRIHDFYIDDSLWRLRYIVVETGNWMSRRRVLIALFALGGMQTGRHEFHVNLSREQVRNSPDIDTEKPVSRQQEIAMNAHYGWPAHWNPATLIVPTPILDILRRRKKEEGDVHLRSIREISTYDVRHGQDCIAKVHDFVIDGSDWSLIELVAACGDPLEGRLVVFPSDRVIEISWSQRTLFVDLDKDGLEECPTLDYEYPVNREETVMYFDHCGRPADPPSAAAAPDALPRID